ncbi:hypothetical protein J6590_065902 [Homalodisca vitripennis]|nr:hypothetical protein J6590_065902 [Homalodisca vitripennis]
MYLYRSSLYITFGNHDTLCINRSWAEIASLSGSGSDVRASVAVAMFGIYQFAQRLGSCRSAVKERGSSLVV